MTTTLGCILFRRRDLYPLYSATDGRTDAAKMTMAVFISSSSEARGKVHPLGPI